MHGALPVTVGDVRPLPIPFGSSVRSKGPLMPTKVLKPNVP